MINCFSGVKRIGSFFGATGNSPVAILSASVRWQTIPGAVNLPQRADSSGVSRSIRDCNSR